LLEHCPFGSGRDLHGIAGLRTQMR
jgi:hypothetical protein